MNYDIVTEFLMENPSLISHYFLSFEELEDLTKNNIFPDDIEKRLSQYVGKVCRCRFGTWTSGSLSEMVEDIPTLSSITETSEVQYYFLIPLKGEFKVEGEVNNELLERSLLISTEIPKVVETSTDGELFWGCLYKQKIH